MTIEFKQIPIQDESEETTVKVLTTGEVYAREECLAARLDELFGEMA